jgi:hypothetical protein
LRIVDEVARPSPAAKPQRALFLVGDTAKNQADSLLAPAGAYSPGDRLRLETPGRTFLIVINRVIQKGAGWERTGFNVEEKLITGSFR